MNVLIFSLVIGLLQMWGAQPAVGHTDTILKPSVILSHVDQQRTHSIFSSPIPGGLIGIVPVTASRSCYNGRHALVTLGPKDLPSDGPTCAPASSNKSSMANSGEPLHIFPLTEEGTLEEGACVAIPAPQAYCDIPLDSPFSAFPLV